MRKDPLHVMETSYKFIDTFELIGGTPVDVFCILMNYALKNRLLLQMHTRTNAFLFGQISCDVMKPKWNCLDIKNAIKN